MQTKAMFGVANVQQDLDDILNKLNPTTKLSMDFQIKPTEPSEETASIPNIIRVTGRVIYVKKDWKSWTVVTRSDVKFYMTYESFCPIRVGDIISAICVPVVNNNVRIVQSPAVITPCDEDSMVNCFLRLFNKQLGYRKCKYLYDRLNGDFKNSIYDCFQDIEEFISHIVEKWNSSHTREAKLLYPINDVVGDANAIKLAIWWRKSVDKRKLYLLGLTYQEIKNSKRSHRLLYQDLLKNPYTVVNIGIEKCRDIDIRTGRKPEVTDHYCGLVIRKMYENMTSKGWSATSYVWLNKRFDRFGDFEEILTKDFGVVFDTVELLDEDAKKYRVAYLRQAHNAETYVSDFITQRLKPFDADDIVSGITAGPVIDLPDQPIYNKKLDDNQRAAIDKAIKGGVSILTGGPGTGKTSTIEDLVKIFSLNGIPYALTSFTGRAVSRIKDVVGAGCKPATLHRMIHSPHLFAVGDKLDKDNLSYMKVLIIDEASMVTTELFYHFLMTFGTNISVIFVGDANQLPPISWGSLFHEMLKSLCVPKTVLTNNYRVLLNPDQDNAIIRNLERVVAWPKNTPYIFETGSNFYTIDGNERNVVDILKAFKTKNVTQDEFKIVSPYNRYLDDINRMAQLIYHGHEEYVKTPHDKIFYVGDMVMCLRNNYESNVMNGEEGIVTDIGFDSITVDFHEGRLVKVPFAGDKDKHKYRNNEEEEKTDMDTDAIKLSYAVTIHKVQGSEYQFVVFLMPSFANASSSGFLNRNLVYTGLSRARKYMYHIGNMMVTSVAVGNSLPYRCEFLSNRLRSGLKLLYEKEVVIEINTYMEPEEGELPPDDFWDEYD